MPVSFFLVFELQHPSFFSQAGRTPLFSNSVSPRAVPSLADAATAAGWAVNSSFLGACAFFLADVHLALSEAHVLEGPWWLALFTDPSDTRFQSKMVRTLVSYPWYSPMRGAVSPCACPGSITNISSRSSEDLAGVCLQTSYRSATLRSHNLFPRPPCLMQIQRGPVYPFSLNVTIAGCGSGGQCQQNKAGLHQSGQSLGSDAMASQAPLRLASSDSTPSIVEAMLQDGQTLLSTLESTLPWFQTVPSAESKSTPAAPTATSLGCYSTNQSFPLYVPSPATLNLSLRLLRSPDGQPLPNFSVRVRWGAPPLGEVTGALVPDGQISLPSAGALTGLLEAQVPNAQAGWCYLRVVFENAAADGRFCVESWQWEAIGCEEGRGGEQCAWPVTRLGVRPAGALWCFPAIGGLTLRSEVSCSFSSFHQFLLSYRASRFTLLKGQSCVNPQNMPKIRKMAGRCAETIVVICLRSTSVHG